MPLRFEVRGMPATFEIRTRPMIRWAEVAIEHERLAREARERLVSDHAAGRAFDLARELRPAMVAVAACAHSLDSLCFEFLEFVGPARAQRRFEEIASALERSADVSDLRDWRSRLGLLFHRRDEAVHPERKTSRPLRHPGLPIRVAREYRDYSVESASESVDLLLDVLTACVESPKPAVEQWAGDARASVERLRGLRD
jgi:hypothetical protein